MQLLRAAAVLSLLTLVTAPVARGQSCETGDGRTFADPLESFTIVPTDAPVELEADKSGKVTLVTKNSPVDVVVPVSTNLGGRNGIAVQFFFRKRTTADVRVTTPVGSPALPGAIYIERETTKCATGVDTLGVGADPFVATGDPDSKPIFVDTSLASGAIDLTFRLTFSPNVVYRLVFFTRKAKNQEATSFVFTPFAGAESATPDADPLLKLLPKGVDPVTGCIGTDVSNLADATFALKKAFFHADSVEKRFDTSNGAATAPARTDDDRVRALIDLARAHLRCAREIVERRTDLPDVTKSGVLAEIDASLASCDEADAALDAPVPGIKDKAVREVSQLRTAASRLNSAVISSNSAGTRLIGYVEPQLPAGYASGDPVPAAASVMKSSLDRVDEEMANLKEKFERLKQVARDEGEAGVRRILASNANPACTEFIKVKMLAELRSIAMLADTKRREDAVSAAHQEALAQIQADADAEAKLLEKAYPKVVAPVVVEAPVPTPKEVSKADKHVQGEPAAKLSAFEKKKLALQGNVNVALQ